MTTPYLLFHFLRRMSMKTYHLRAIYLTVGILLGLCIFTSAVRAQGFELSTNPSTKIITAGESTEFTIHINPIGGFKASVVVTASSQLSCQLSQEVCNSPYPDITLSVKSTPADTGVKYVWVVGRNMNVMDTVVCALHINKNIRWQQMPKPASFMAEPSTTIDQNGDFAIVDGGHIYPAVYRFLNQKWEKTEFKDIHDGMGSLQGVFDQSGTLWMRTEVGLCRYDGNFLTIFNSTNSDLPSNQPAFCERDRNGRIYVRVLNKIYRYESDTHFSLFATVTDTVVTYAPYTAVNIFGFDSTNALVAATGQDHHALRRIPGDDSALVGQIYGSGLSCVHTAADGSIWTLFGYNVQPSISRFKNGILHTDALPLPSATRLRWMSSDIRGYIWVASSEGLCMYDGNGWTVFNRTNSPLPFNSIQRVECDARGNVWIVNGTEVVVFNPDGLKGIPLLSSAVDNDTSLLAPKQEYSVYPSPGSDKLYVSASAVHKVQLYSVLGSCILACDAKGDASFTLDVHDVPEGTYILCVNGRASTVTIQH